jgi:APA family basic amino acid/polyamine antiporter
MKEKQGINFFSLTMIVVSLVIGMGIFKTPATIAAKAGTPTIFFCCMDYWWNISRMGHQNG